MNILFELEIKKRSIQSDIATIQHKSMCEKEFIPVDYEEDKIALRFLHNEFNKVCEEIKDFRGN